MKSLTIDQIISIKQVLLELGEIQVKPNFAYKLALVSVELDKHLKAFDEVKGKFLKDKVEDDGKVKEAYIKDVNKFFDEFKNDKYDVDVSSFGMEEFDILPNLKAKWIMGLMPIIEE